MATWSGKRRFIYGTSTVIVIILVCIYLFRDTLFPTPTCFDQKQNGYESGIDCGGSCSLRCASQVIPLTVSWTQALRTSSSTYDLVALVSNKNLDSAPRQVSYTFVAYDVEGKELNRFTGTSLAPIGGDFPVIIPNIKLPITFSTVTATVAQNMPQYKATEQPTSPTVTYTNATYESGAIPRVYATVINTKRIVIRNLEVRALVFDDKGNAYAAGKTLIPELGKEGVQQVVFTWDGAFPTTPTKIRVYPIVDPFLGAQ